MPIQTKRLDEYAGVNRIALLNFLVVEYDEAIRFFVDKLNFELVEDTRLSDTKRWVRVRPRGTGLEGGGTRGAELLLAQAATTEQRARVGDQAGGRVFLFLETSDFDRDYERMRAAGVRFVESPREEPYGRVAVFEDLYGNRWDLIEPSENRTTGASA